MKSIFNRYNQSLNVKENIYTSLDFFILKWLTFKTEAKLGQNIRRSGNVGVDPIHQANWEVTIKQNYDLIRALNFWFWETKENKSSFAHKNSNLELGFSYKNISRITDNISHDVYSPDFVITFNWFDIQNISQTFKISMGLTFTREDHEDYLIQGGHPDDSIIFNNLRDREQGFKKNETGIDFSIFYSTGIPLLRKWLQKLTRLTLKRNPRYSIEFRAEFNRFDYDIFTDLLRQPSDLYILDQNLDINLHTHVIGEVSFKTVLDISRDQETNRSRERIIAFQIGLTIKIIF